MTDIRKEIGGEEEKSVKVAELRRIEQRGKTMDEFIQEFKRATRRSKCKERPLMEEFRRGINTTIY